MMSDQPMAVAENGSANAMSAPPPSSAASSKSSMESPSANTPSQELPSPTLKLDISKPFAEDEELKLIIETLAKTTNGSLAELGYFPGTLHKLHELDRNNVRLHTLNQKLFEDNKTMAVFYEQMKRENLLLKQENMLLKQEIDRLRNFISQPSNQTIQNMQSQAGGSQPMDPSNGHSMVQADSFENQNPPRRGRPRKLPQAMVSAHTNTFNGASAQTVMSPTSTMPLRTPSFVPYQYPSQPSPQDMQGPGPQQLSRPPQPNPQAQSHTQRQPQPQQQGSISQQVMRQPQQYAQSQIPSQPSRVMQTTQGSPSMVLPPYDDPNVSQPSHRSRQQVQHQQQVQNQQQVQHQQQSQHQQQLQQQQRTQYQQQLQRQQFQQDRVMASLRQRQNSSSQTSSPTRLNTATSAPAIYPPPNTINTPSQLFIQQQQQRQPLSASPTSMSPTSTTAPRIPISPTSIGSNVSGPPAMPRPVPPPTVASLNEIIDLTSYEDDDEPSTTPEPLRKKRRTEEIERSVSSLGGQLKAVSIDGSGNVPGPSHMGEGSGLSMTIAGRQPFDTAPPASTPAEPPAAPDSAPAPPPEVVGTAQNTSQTLNESISTFALSTTTDSAPASDPQVVATDVAMGGEEDEEEDIELDADGLIPIQICLEEAFRPNENSQPICRMCEARFIQLAKDDPSVPAPKPFINPTSDDLVKHCEEEHPVGWERLRTPAS